MTERQKQHLGRSEDDDTTLEGRDVRKGAVAGTGDERASDAGGEDQKASKDALHVEKLLEKAKQRGPSESSED